MAAFVDFQNEEEVKKYLDDLGTEYRYSCLHENNAEGCHLLGRYLETIKSDYKKSALIFKNNCDDNKFSNSCFYYGRCAYSGTGVDQSYDVAFEYLKKGCDLGNAECCFHSGVMLTSREEKPKFRKNSVEGMKYLLEGCERKNAMSCFFASGLYINGAEGIPADMKKAADLSKTACDLGNALACINLYQMHKKGDGVEKNETLAQQYKNKGIDIRKQMKNKEIRFQEFA